MVLPRPPAPNALVRDLRAGLADQVRGLVAGDGPPVRDLSHPVTGDAGLFGPHSVTWRVHQDASMFVGGLRALLLQTMHPLAMAGVADHSAYREDPLGRLTRTATYVGVTTFGTTAQARGAIASVRRVHDRVTGVAPDGRRYRANDPHLLTWVHHTLVDSFLRAFRRYGAGPITRTEADRYVDEMAVLAEEWGAEPAARSVTELRAYFHAVTPELAATPAARDAARWLCLPPLPLAARPAYAVILPAAVGLLPGSTRRSLRLPWAPGLDPLVVRPATIALVRSIDWVMAGWTPERPTRSAT